LLRNTSPERIVSFLRSESPQTIALVIAHVHPTLAGQVLSQLPDTLQAETALPIAEMGTVSPNVVRASTSKYARTSQASPNPRHQ
jgi:flagellar motor switch protein FliG